MEKKNISEILKKYLSGRFPSQTEERVQKWIVKDENTIEKEKASFEYWNELKTEIGSDTYSALERVNNRTGHTKRDNRISLHRNFARVAAVFIPLLLIAGGYFYYNSSRSELIEISVAYGENKHFLLPDSSAIWLNAGTTLKYPKDFKGDRREIYLDGEAYFDVMENEKKPFVVQTELLSVKVLGTKFNVKAYSNDEKVITTLTSGKVEVNAGLKEPSILKPNEQLTYNKISSTIEITDIQPYEIEGWMKGQLIFSGKSLSEISQMLERKFNIFIEDRTAIPSTKVYTIKFLKNESLEEILNVLNDVVGITYRKDKDKIILSNK